MIAMHLDASVHVPCCPLLVVAAAVGAVKLDVVVNLRRHHRRYPTIQLHDLCVRLAPF